jgi:hypothetical protein
MLINLPQLHHHRSAGAAARLRAVSSGHSPGNQDRTVARDAARPILAGAETV